MLFLVLAIVLSAGTSLVIRYAEGKGHNGNNVMLVNYIMSTALSFGYALTSGRLSDIAEIVNAEPLRLFAEKTVGNSVLLFTVIGLFSGVYYMVSLVIIRRSYFLNGVGITMMFSKSCFVLSAAVAFFIWHEVPQGLQIAGSLLSVLALIIVFSGSGKGDNITSVPHLLMAFGINGLMQISNKLYTGYCFSAEHRGMYFTVLYGSAAVVAYLLVRSDCKREQKKLHLTAKEWAYGLAAGTFNFGFNLTQLSAIQRLPAGLVFPCLAAGGLLIGAIAGSLLFKERLGQKQKLAIVVTITGLVLANL